MKFNNKVAIVTGAGRGIGEAVATSFVKEGAAVVLVDVDYNDLEGVKKKLAAIEGRVIGVQANVAFENNWDLILEKCLDQFGTVDILVNNAGITSDAGIAGMRKATWDQVIDVNLKGAFLGCQTVVPIMLEKSYGKIVNISSAARLDDSGPTSYAVAQAGVAGMTCSLAKELGEHGISVNAIAPGVIMSDMFKSVPDTLVEEAKGIITLSPGGEPAEIAAACLSLASDEFSFVTGQILYANGGTFMS